MDGEDDYDGPNEPCEADGPGTCQRCGHPTWYERGCAWCGLVFDVCLCCRARTWICQRCFVDSRNEGKERARELATARERERRRGRARRRAARLGRPRQPQQATLWPGDVA